MNRLSRSVSSALFSLTLLASTKPVLAEDTLASQPTEAGQHAAAFDGTISFKLNYLLFLPEDYGKDADKRWPLIVFLHGSGERGNDVNMVKRHGPPKIVETKKDFPFIVLSPQCPPDSGWETYQLNALLDKTLATYHADEDRVDLTGLSMGGFETWDWAVKNPKRFAAIAPMCGGGNPSLAHRIKDLPIWVSTAKRIRPFRSPAARNGRGTSEGRRRRAIHALPRRRA